MTNEDTTDFDEHFAKISSYIVDTLHGVPLEMTEDEKEQFRMDKHCILRGRIWNPDFSRKILNKRDAGESRLSL